MASAASSNLEKEVRKNIDDFAAEMIKINWEQLLSMPYPQLSADFPQDHTCGNNFYGLHACFA